MLNENDKRISAVTVTIANVKAVFFHVVFLRLVSEFFGSLFIDAHIYLLLESHYCGYVYTYPFPLKKNPT